MNENRSKQKWSLGLSIIAIILSFIAVYISWSQHDKNNLFLDAPTIAIAVLGGLVTLLVAWQIYGTLQIDDKIKDQKKEVEGLLERNIERLENRVQNRIEEIDDGLKERYQALESQGDQLNNIVKQLQQSGVLIPSFEGVILQAFNSPERLARDLSTIGIGSLGNWRESVSGINHEEYIAFTPYLQFGDLKDYTKIPSNIAIYLEGKKGYAESLDVVLNIGYQQNAQEALAIFMSTIQKIERILNIGIDLSWIEDNIEGGETTLEGGYLHLTKEDYGRILTYKLHIQANKKKTEA